MGNMIENSEQFNTGLKTLNHLPPADFIAGEFSPLNWQKRTFESKGFWLPYIPKYEVQNDFGVDKMNCTAMATDNFIETDLKEQTGVEINISDRHISVIAGNTKDGNYVHKPIEAIALLGFVFEDEYPEKYLNTPTWEEYHQPLPPSIPPKAQNALLLYKFDREFIFPSNDPNLLYERLSEAPIKVTVRYASSANPNEILNPVGKQNHDILIVGAKKNEYWIMYDSYAWQRGLPTLKRYAWDYPFGTALRINIQLISNNLNYMFKQNYPYLLVEGNEQKLGFYLDGRLIIDTDWSKILVQSSSRLKRYEPAIPVKLKEWASIPHVNLKGEPTV